MIEYIKGDVMLLEPTLLIVETHGIGYAINIPLTVYTSLNNSNQTKDVTIFIKEIIREDAHLLYGFISRVDRAFFELLITVSGIGANTARTILSAYSTAELRQIIANGDANALNKIKGIGAKTAQRLLVDLKDKMLTLHIDNNDEGSNHYDAPSETRNAATTALTMLGFNANACQKVVDKLLQEQPNATVEEIIKQALKML